MDELDLVGILEVKELQDVEMIKEDDNVAFIKFSYDFDQDEISAARAYANEESGQEEGNSEWYENWYLPYLYDVAKDNIQEIIEEVCEEYELEGEFREKQNYDISQDFLKGYVVFCKDSTGVDIEEIINDYIDLE